MTLKAWLTQTETSVETILAGWTKTIKDLEDHAEAKLAEVVKNNFFVTVYEKAAAEAEAEVQKARDIAAKIKALFN